MNLKNILLPHELTEKVDEEWTRLSDEYEYFAKNTTELQMPRKELSFHSEVKLLGLIAFLLREDTGSIVEIGVWKGKSLTFMKRLSESRQTIIGIDPLELPGQANDFAYFKQAFFSDAKIIKDYSEIAIGRVAEFAEPCKLLHIDGGHKKENVVLDFLLYAPLVKKSGLIVFDDYGDYQYSPEVKLAVDMLQANGYFAEYEVYGSIWGYHGSYVLHKK